MLTEIEQYWNVQPPFKAEYGEEGTLEWSNSIIEHRLKIAPYLPKFMEFEYYRGKHILEIGCGSGSDSILYATHGAKVTSIDITDYAIAMTSKRAALHGVEIDTIKYDGKTLDLFRDNTFDLVYSYGVLHHTPYMQDLLVESYRVLKPDGRIKLMIYNRNSVLYYYLMYLYKVLKKSELSRSQIISKYSEFREGCPLTQVFTLSELEQLLEESGFNKIKSEIDLPLYDSEEGRKVSYEGKVFDIKNTGHKDIDLFFDNYNFINSISINRNFTKEYGWHLLTTFSKTLTRMFK